MTIPFLFAASTVLGTLSLVYVIAHFITMPTYVTNLVYLIGLGIAIDYSLLIVYRFREELAHGLEVEAAIVRTMQTAGRAVVFSGATVAIGLALLIFMPLPFIRAIGIGGFLLPVVSLLAAATLQPALLSIYGRRGTHRVPVAAFLRDRLRLPGARRRPAGRRRAPLLGAPGALDHAAEVALRARDRGAAPRRSPCPVAWLQLTPGATAGIPQSPQSVRGLNVLKTALGPGAIAPAQVLVDTGRPGGVSDPAVAGRDRPAGRAGRGATRRSAATYYLPGGRFVDRTGRYAQVIVATRHEYGSEEAQAFVDRLRHALIPAAAFPAGRRGAGGRRIAPGCRLPARRLRRVPVARRSPCSCSPTCC